MNRKILSGPPLNYTINSSLGQFFFESAEKFGNRLCQIDPKCNKKETFSSVKRRSVRIALGLRKKGITSKDLIVTCSTVTLDTAIPILASFYLGAKVANLDVTLSRRQIKHLLSLVSPSVIFVEEPSLSLIEQSLEDANINAMIVVFGKSIKYVTFSDLDKPQENEEEFKPLMVDICNTALIFFSSGTTELPKAISHSHYSFLHNCYSSYQTFIKGDAILSFTSFYWISGMYMLTFSFIAGGYRIISNHIDDGEIIFKTIEKYKVTHLFMAPILTYKLTNCKKWDAYDTSSLYTVLTGGTPISPVQFQKLATIFRHSNIILTYGLTETGLMSAYNPRTDQKFINNKIGSSGKLLPCMTVKIVDLETKEILGPNQKGEIYIKTPALMTKYYHADTSDLLDKDGFLKTGDVGYYDEEECFYIIDRVKEMFKFMSWHIVPSSIENVLLECPAVEEAVVFGIPKSEEEGEVPAACVVLREHFNASKEEIAEFVAARVSDREKLRGGVFFLDKLLRTPSGKLMRKEIRKSVIDSL